MRGMWRLALAGSAVVCAAQNSGTGQAGEAPPTLHVEAQTVVLDVVVESRNGEPVKGLRADDFQVAENGTPQKIVYFEEHGPTAAPAHPYPPLPPDVFTNVPRGQRGDSMNVILIDTMNSSRQTQVWEQQQLRAFFETAKPDVPMAIFSLTSHLHLIHDFTTDSAALLQALSDKKAAIWPDTTALARETQDDVQDLEDIQTLEMMLSGTMASSNDIPMMQRAQAEHRGMQENAQRAATLEALEALARYLARQAGRKNVFWFADRFPMAFTADANAGNSTPGGIADTPIREATNLLAEARIAVYPIAATGVDTDGMTSASVWSLSTAQSASGLHAQARVDSTLGMNRIAEQTGGQAIQNHNFLTQALDEAIGVGEHYYTLSYIPTDTVRDGKMRRIAVKTTDGKDRLSYRRGYYANDTSAQPMAPLRNLLMKSVPDAMELVFVTRVSPDPQTPPANPRLKGPLRRYRVDVLIPAAEAPLALDGDRHRGQLEVDVVAWGKDGRAVGWTGGPVEVNLDAATYATEQKVGLPMHLAIDVPENADSLKVGVYDAGRAGTMLVELNEVHALAEGTAPQKP